MIRIFLQKTINFEFWTGSALMLSKNLDMQVCELNKAASGAKGKI
jgi:hypothetical protein